MSRAMKRKHVLREIWEDDFTHPKPNQQIVKVISCRGNNLHEVQAPGGDAYLVSMPNKFRQTFWIKRGQYVIVDPIEEGRKVKGEIARIVTDQLIELYHKDNVWPSAFVDATENKNAYPTDYYEKSYYKNNIDTCSDDDGLFRNPNIPRYAVVTRDSDIESSEDDETDSEDENSDEEGDDTQSEDANHH